jgi:hypothetical protein
MRLAPVLVVMVLRAGSVTPAGEVCPWIAASDGVVF